MKPKITVVVPTCGRPALLARCLQALESQSLPRDRYEVIVSEDRHHEGPATARNRGWKRSRAPVVAFTDDDCIPDRDWLRRGLEALAGGADAVCGRIVMPLGHSPTDYERDAQGLERAEFVTANCFIRKEMLERVGGFDERFRLAWREDSDLHFALLAQGARIAREPHAVVVHPVRPANWGVSLRQQRKVMFDALLFRKYPRLYRERIRAAPRWDYYVIVASLFAGPFWPPAWLVWFSLSAAFCWRRLKGASWAPLHVLEMMLTSMAIPPLAVFWRVMGALRFRVAFL